jgi:hypothetical protein
MLAVAVSAYILWVVSSWVVGRARRHYQGHSMTSQVITRRKFVSLLFCNQNSCLVDVSCFFWLEKDSIPFGVSFSVSPRHGVLYELMSRNTH